MTCYVSSGTLNSTYSLTVDRKSNALTIIIRNRAARRKCGNEKYGLMRSDPSRTFQTSIFHHHPPSFRPCIFQYVSRIFRSHFYRATLCVARFCCRAVSVHLSVTLVHCVETAKLAIKLFFIAWWPHHSSFLTGSTRL